MSDTLMLTASRAASSASGTLDLIAQSAQRGAADAREAANRTWDSAGRFMNRFVYTTCYTVSYGVVFPAVLIARAVPRENMAVRGLVDGATAACARVNAPRSTAPLATEAVSGP